MRSALAGAASNVVAVKTAAAVPMNVIERMFHLLWCSATTMKHTLSSSKKRYSVLFLAENF
jgi:hypothetical protein